MGAGGSAANPRTRRRIALTRPAAGDTLTIEMEFTKVRPTRKPDRYVLCLRDVAFKQDGQMVAEDTRVFLVERKT